MLYVGKKKQKEFNQFSKKQNLFSWSYMLQIEECQVKIQYKSHLIEFQHHIEEVERFFINQVKISFFNKNTKK